MSNLKKILFFGVGLILGTAAIAYAAPTAQNFQNIQPFTNNTYFNGTAALKWSNLFTVNASTTNLTVSSAAGTPGCASFTATGVIANSGTPCGTGNGTVTNVTAASPNSTLILGGTNPITTSGTINYDFNLSHSNTWTVQQIFSSLFSTNASTTNATTSQETVTSLANAAGTFIAADAAGRLIATTTPTSGSGGAAYPFTPGTNYNIAVSATTTAISDSQGFMASSTSYFQGLSNFNWTLSTSSVDVCAFQCAYSTIQSALNAGWKNIHVKEGTYVLAATTTIASDSVSIHGDGDATVIQFPGTSVGAAFADATPASTKFQQISISNMKLQSTNVGSGLGIRLDGIKLSNFDNLHIVDTFGCAWGDANGVFYDHIDGLLCEPEGGSVGSSTPSTNNFMVKFTNNANQNIISNSRYIVSATGSTTAYYLDSAGERLIGTDVEGASANGAAAIGVYVGPNANDVSISDSWFEFNYTNLYISNGVKTVTMTGNHFTCSPGICLSQYVGGIDDEGGIGVLNLDHDNGDPIFMYNGANVHFGVGTGTVATAFETDVYNAASKAVARIHGGGSSEIQSAIQLESTGSVRGAGIFRYDIADATKEFWGTLYNSADAWGVNFQTGATESGTSAANPLGTGVTNLLYLNTAGNLGLSSTTPTAKLSIVLTTNPLASTTLLAFAIASSTPTATTTIFSVDNTGIASSTKVVASNLTSGNCVQASTGGLLTTTGSACGAGGGGVTQVNTTFPILGGPITTTGTLTFGGLSTSSPLAAGAAVIYATGVNTVASAATTSASCAGSDSCTAFTVLGSSPVTITGNGTTYTYPFTVNTTYGTTSAATTTALNAPAFFASSTQANIFPYATSTYLSAAELGINSGGSLDLESGGSENTWVIGRNNVTSPVRSMLNSNSMYFTINSTSAGQGFGFLGGAKTSILELNSADARAFFRGSVGVGTTTSPLAGMPQMQLASSTAPQLGLFSNVNNYGWTFRTLGDSSLVIATTTLSGATSTVNALTIDPNGKLGIATSSPDAMLTISNALSGIAGLIIHTWMNVTNAFSIVNAAGTTVFNVDTTNTTGAKFGVGTSTPYADLSVQANSGDTNYSLFTIASSTATATTTLFSVTNTGHIIASSTNPVLSSCGTTPTMKGDDTHGEVTAGTSATACTITFGQAWSAAPVCIVQNQSGSITNTFSYTISSTQIVVTETALGGDKVDYLCEGVSGNQ